MKHLRAVIAVFAVVLMLGMANAATPVTAFEYFPSWSSVAPPERAVESLTYTLGAIFFGNTTSQIVDVSWVACSPAQANALLGSFQALRSASGTYPYAKWTVSATTGTVVAYQYFGNYAIYSLYDQYGDYEGNVQGYLISSYAFNSVNGGGVGNPGSWQLGKYEPVWAPVPYAAASKE